VQLKSLSATHRQTSKKEWLNDRIYAVKPHILLFMIRFFNRFVKGYFAQNQPFKNRLNFKSKFHCQNVVKGAVRKEA
jgi:hypothetical protein